MFFLRLPECHHLSLMRLVDFVRDDLIYAPVRILPVLAIARLGLYPRRR